LNSSTEISTGIVSSVQLWAKVSGILSGTNNGIEIHIFNVTYKKVVEIGFEKLAFRLPVMQILVSGTYLERFKPAGKIQRKLQERTPREEMLGQGGLIVESS